MTNKKMIMIIGGVLLGIALITLGATLIFSSRDSTYDDDYFEGFETTISGVITEAGFISGWDYDNNRPLEEVTSVSLEDGEIMTYMYVSDIDENALVGVYRMFPDGDVESEYVNVSEDAYVTVSTSTERGPGTYVIILTLGEQIVINEIEVTE